MEKTILILAANPKDTTRLRLDEEVRGIEEGLERSPRRDEFKLHQRWATRPIDVRRAMLYFKPNIVHFCGHGQAYEGLAFEDATGISKLVDADTLAEFFELFSQKGVECIVLNACYSEIQAEAIKEHIDYVIGMSRKIGDTASIEFAVAFYDALGAGETIEFAYKLACNAIRWTGIPEHLTPKLKSKIPSQSGLTIPTESEASKIQVAQKSVTESKPVMRSLDSDLPIPPSWLVAVEVPDPLGVDVLIFNNSVGTFIDTNVYEGGHTLGLDSGEYEFIEGHWFGYWNRTDNLNQPRYEGDAHILIVDNWAYIYYEDVSRYVIKAKMAGRRLIGRYINLSNKRDTTPWVGVIVNNRQIFGRFLGGRWDFRR